MPDGITHMEIGIVGGVALCGLAWYAGYPHHVAELALGGVIGLFVNPDLDQDGRTHSETLLRQIPLIGFLWQWLWYGYAMLFRHRGWSHHIVIGTLSRLAWSALLGLLLAGLATGVGYLWHGAARDWLDVLRAAVGAVTPALVLAWWWQDALHVLADWTLKGK